MPNWKTHIEIGKKLNNYLNYNSKDLNAFLMGNIVPDINNSYIVKNIKNKIDHFVTHFKDFGVTYNIFYNKYGEEVRNNNPIFVGYFVHLFIDYYWNNNFYTSIKGTYMEAKEHDERRIIKQRDFMVYNNKFIDNVIKLEDYDDFLNEVNKIEEVCITKEDLINVENFLEEKNKFEGDYSYYTEEKLDKLLEDSINGALEKLKEINMKNT